MIELIIITALFLYGTKVLCQPGMIFEKPVKWLDTVFDLWKSKEVRKYPNSCNNFDTHTIRCKEPPAWWKWLKKPLYACPSCMSSIWGSAIYYLSVRSTWSYPQDIINLLIFDISVAGLVWILMWQFPFDD